MPNEIVVWGLDSGMRHPVAEADYGSVRVRAFTGYRMIAEQASLTVVQGTPSERQYKRINICINVSVQYPKGTM